MSGIKRKYTLRESEKRAFIKRFIETFDIRYKGIFSEKPKIDVVEIGEKKIFIIDGKPLLVEVEGLIIPTLVFEEVIKDLPKVVIDMGAVPHVCNGADIMAPGVVRVDGEFKAGDLVVVLDEKYGKTISVAKALVDSGATKSLKRGKTLKNLHYVGDPVWKVLKEGLLERKS